MTETKTFAGLPVQGHGGYGHQQKQQRSREELEALFTAALAVEGLEAIRWKQYTPYFNDGDTCYFSVHDVYFRTEGAPEEGGEFDNVLLELFGDHVGVTVTPHGIEVDEYEHD